MILKVCGALIFVILSFGVIAAPALTPAAEFAELPTFKQMAFSPDGSKIVALRAIDETYHVVLFDLEKQSSAVIMAADPDKFLYDWCRFANNERVVCQTHSYDTLVAGDTGFRIRRYADGRTTFFRLVAVNVDRSNMLSLIDPPRRTNSREALEWNAVDQSSVISWLPKDKDHVLVQLARDDRIYPSVYRLNIYNNKMERVRKKREPVLAWIANREGELLMAAGLAGGKNPMAVSLLDGWKELELNFNNVPTPPSVVGIGSNDSSVWISTTNGRDTLGIYRFDLKQGKIAHELFLDPDYDVDLLVQDAETLAPLYVAYATDKSTYVFFDKALESIYGSVRKALPGNPDKLRIEAMDRSQNQFVFYASGNGTSPSYYYFNNDKKRLAPLAQETKKITSTSSLQSVSYDARDGIAIPAYLALPGPEEDGPFPTIILPHGGPYARDAGADDDWTALFLSRGYAVLKPNFRGSWGYGYRYMAKGFNQWGLAMQDDVIDGLDWMIEEGYADPKNVCIVGGSYGGYVAQVAAFKTPEKFKCAVSFAGVSNLDEIEIQRRNSVFGRLATPRIQGGESRDENSPLMNADSFGVPILLVHGDKDHRVFIEHTTELVEALQAADKSYLYLEQEGGDHFLSRHSQRVEFFEAMDEFLARYLKTESP